MRVAIDLTCLMPEATGVDVACLGLVRQLIQPGGAAGCHVTLLINREDASLFTGAGDHVQVKAICIRSRAARLLFQQCALPLLLRTAGFDVLHSPSFLMPLLRAGPTKHLLTICDMTFFTMPQVHNQLRSSAPFLRLVAASIRRAALINVISGTVRDDLCRLFPEVEPARVRVTPLGVDAQYSPAPPAETAAHAARLGLPPSYILHVGTVEPRKNLLALLRAFQTLIAASDFPHHLVLAGGRGWNVDDVYHLAASPELQGRVHFTGRVSADDLPWIYRGASLFVYPSLAEGFGFPPLEAMACGVPVVASGVSSLQENLSGAAMLIPPGNPADLAQAITRLLRDDGERQRLAALGLHRARAFRWERTARLVLDCYRDLEDAESGSVVDAR